MSESSESNGSNGTAEVVNRIGGEGTTVKKTRRKNQGNKTKPSRFADLFESARSQPGKDKGKMRGHVNTDEGEVQVTLQAFPADIADDEYQSTAAASGISVKFDLDGKKVSGVHLDTASRNLKGDAALNFLGDVIDSDSDEFDDKEE